MVLVLRSVLDGLGRPNMEDTTHTFGTTGGLVLVTNGSSARVLWVHW